MSRRIAVEQRKHAAAMGTSRVDSLELVATFVFIIASKPEIKMLLTAFNFFTSRSVMTHVTCACDVSFGLVTFHHATITH